MTQAARRFRRRRPEVVEAMQFDGTAECGAAIVAWARGHGVDAEYVVDSSPEPFPPYVRISRTWPYGVMLVVADEWIVREANGTFHRYKPDAFTEWYEPVNEAKWWRVDRLFTDSAVHESGGDSYNHGYYRDVIRDPERARRLVTKVLERWRTVREGKRLRG